MNEPKSSHRSVEEEGIYHERHGQEKSNHVEQINQSENIFIIKKIFIIEYYYKKVVQPKLNIKWIKENQNYQKD